jgi:osmotically inducible protein OsmC
MKNKGEIMKRQGQAEWMGGLKDGKGSVSTESGVLDHTPYSFHTRFAEEKGTNPEELIAAAHAGCFSMALSAQLEKAGFIAKNIQTSALVSLEKSDDGFSIPTVHLQVTAKIPGMMQNEFIQIANHAKEGCPVSKLLKAKISMDAVLEQ